MGALISFGPPTLRLDYEEILLGKEQGREGKLLSEYEMLK